MSSLFLILILVLKVVLMMLIYSSLSTLHSNKYYLYINSDLAYYNYLKWTKILNTDYYYLFYKTVMIKIWI